MSDPERVFWVAMIFGFLVGFYVALALFVPGVLVMRP